MPPSIIDRSIDRRRHPSPTIIDRRYQPFYVINFNQSIVFFSVGLPFKRTVGSCLLVVVVGVVDVESTTCV